jgi:preprotein translocase subunit SecE
VQNKIVMNIVSYIKESFSELKEHVSWTAIPELSNLTVVVLVFSLIFAGLIWLADSVLSRIVKIYFDFIN